MLSVLKGKAMPYIGIAAALIISGLAFAVWMLMQERDALNAQVGRLEQANEQLIQSIQEQAAENRRLQSEIVRTDHILTEAIRGRQQAEAAADNSRNTLREALADNECAQTPHPSAITDSLRQLSAGHQDADSVPLPADSAD